jgi:hypothetical protein
LNLPRQHIKKLQHALPFFRQRTAVHAYLKISVFSIQVLLKQALFDAGASQCRCFLMQVLFNAGASSVIP